MNKEMLQADWNLWAKQELTVSATSSLHGGWGQLARTQSSVERPCLF